MTVVHALFNNRDLFSSSPLAGGWFLVTVPGVPLCSRWEAAVMLTLASKLKRDDGVRGPRASSPASDSTRRVSVRDKLLVKGERIY